MPVRVTSTDAVAEIQCVGDCDLETAPDVEDAIFRVMRRGYRLLLIDLSRTHYLDSRGVRMLLRARGEIEAHEGRLVVLGLNWQPRRALDLVGLRQVLHCVQSREDAIAYLTAARA